jgi:hypothetical protein
LSVGNDADDEPEEAMKTINGYSEERITSMMRRWEKLIA